MDDKGMLRIVSPFTGRVKRLDDTPKAKFSSKMIGEGLAIEPSEGMASSPVTGEVVQVFPTKHAVTITTDSNVEVMVHVGMDTQQLEGEGFELHVKEKDHVHTGDLLISFDMEKIKEQLISISSPVIVVNPNVIAELEHTNESIAKRRETVLYNIKLVEED